MITWRQVVQESDKAIIFRLTRDTGVFSDEEVNIAVELADEKLLEGDVCSYQFLFAEQDRQVVGYSCFGLIPFTDRRFDLYWIAVDKKLQKQGIGKKILQRSEEIMLSQGGEQVYAETSGRDDYIATRHFYQRNQYIQMAELPNYYRHGDSKIIYCKEL